MQALFRVKAEERGAAKPSVAELRAMRKAQKQAQQPVAPPAPAPVSMGPPPPRSVQPQRPQEMQPPPPRQTVAPVSESRIVESSPVAARALPVSDEHVAKRMRVEETQPEPSTSAPTIAAPAGALPAGFFDNKQLDQKARGVEQPKLDPKCASVSVPYGMETGHARLIQRCLGVYLCCCRSESLVCRQEWKLFQESVQEEIQELENKEVEEQVRIGAYPMRLCLSRASVLASYFQRL